MKNALEVLNRIERIAEDKRIPDASARLLIWAEVLRMFGHDPITEMLEGKGPGLPEREEPLLGYGPGTEIPCPDCGKSFRARGGLTLHTTKMHGH